ncbi:MAG: hypothetical protein Q9217_005803 [Psora testacea]
MVEQIKNAGSDRARRAIGGLLDLQPTHSEERDRGPLTHDDEEEDEDEDGAYRGPYGDNESGYVENCGSERQDDEPDSHHFKDVINNDAGPLRGQLDDDNYKTSYMDGKKTACVLLFCIDSSFPTDVTRRLQVAATDDENIRLIEEIGAMKTIPGLTDYMSTLKENRSVAKILAPAVISCIAGLRILNEAGTRAKMVTLEDLISLLPYRSCAQPPTLKTMGCTSGARFLQRGLSENSVLFELLRQSTATSTSQDSSNNISLIPYFTTNGGARKETQERIAQDLTNRVIAESGLSGVSRSLAPGNIKRQLKRLQENTKATKRYTRYDQLEEEFHATRQQALDAQPGAPSELLVICPK